MAMASGKETDELVTRVYPDLSTNFLSDVERVADPVVQCACNESFRQYNNHQDSGRLTTAGFLGH